MPIAAVIDLTDADPLPALLGLPLLEVQLRWLVEDGCRHVVLIGPARPAVTGAARAVRSAEVRVDIAERAAALPDLLHPNETVVLADPRVVLKRPLRRALLSGETPQIVTVPNQAELAAYELVDASARWTGWARLPAELVRQVAAGLGEWQLSSTIVRTAVQHGAPFLPIAGNDPLWIENVHDAAAVAPRLVQQAEPQGGWGQRVVVAPIAELLATSGARFGIKGNWLLLLGAVFAAVALVAAYLGWAASACAGLLGAAMAGDAGSRLAAATGRLRATRGALPLAIVLVAALALLFVAARLWQASGQWGVLPVAAVLAGATWLTNRLMRSGADGEAWWPDVAGHVVLVLLTALVGAPVAGLALGAGHAVASLAILQRRLLQRLSTAT